MSHWEWMGDHMSAWGAGHWFAMGLGWVAIIAGLIAVGYVLGRARRDRDD